MNSPLGVKGCTTPWAWHEFYHWEEARPSPNPSNGLSVPRRETVLVHPKRWKKVRINLWASWEELRSFCRLFSKLDAMCKTIHVLRPLSLGPFMVFSMDELGKLSTAWREKAIIVGRDSFLERSTAYLGSPLKEAETERVLRSDRSLR